MNCPVCGTKMIDIPVIFGPTEKFDPQTGTYVPILNSKPSKGEAYACPNADCDSKKSLIRTKIDYLDTAFPANVDGLIKKIDILKVFLAFHHLHKTLLSHISIHNFIKNYQGKTEYEKQFDYSKLAYYHHNITIQNWLEGIYILFVITQLEDILGVYRKTSNIKISYYDIDEFIILETIRNGVAHGFIWKISARFAKLHLPKTYKGFEYSIELHGKPMDLNNINCELIYSLLSDLSLALKSKIV